MDALVRGSILTNTFLTSWDVFLPFQHTVDRSKSNTRFQDTQSQEATKAKEEREHGYSKSGVDAANLSNKNTGNAQKNRDANSTNSAEGKKYNPGQEGEQGR
jgi:hypothetical protein